MATELTANIRDVLGASPRSDRLLRYLQHLTSLSGQHQDALEPEVKAYTDVLYMNYMELGISLLFVPSSGKSIPRETPLEGSKVELDSIDIYNVIESEKTANKKTSPQYKSYPAFPVSLPLESKKDRTVENIEIEPKSTGKDIIGCLGEPDRKGGGSGPSSGSINIWCEWSKDGIMVEFGGNEARGPQAWDKGKDAYWKVLTVFRPKTL